MNRGRLVEVLDDRGAGPPLVYVPGIDGTGELLLGTAARLRASWRLVRLRYPPAPLPDAERGYAELADGVAACLDERGIARALVLAESFGVAVALATAHRHPDRVAALALVNGFARFDRRGQLLLSSAGARLVPRWLFRHTRRLLAQPLLFAPGRDEEALRELCALPGAWFDAAYRRRLALIRRVDLRPVLPAITAPVALFAADGDRVVRSLAAAREMASALPDVTLEVLHRKGHLVLPLADEPWLTRLEALVERCTVSIG